MHDSDIQQRYFLTLLAAFVRGHPKCQSFKANASELFECSLAELSIANKCDLYRLGIQTGLRLHKFKRTMNLARGRKVLGVLQGLSAQSLLDIGTGRGAFLWPLLDLFQDLSVSCVDIREDRVNDLNSVSVGGVENLSANVGSVESLRYENNAFDVVTALEVIEHCPQPNDAISEICRVGERFAIISVPSKPDDNPEHLHLFDEAKLKEIFGEQGIPNVQFIYVPGHIIAVANLKSSAPK